MNTRVEVGRYRLIERIGEGGMAEVWRADSPSDGRVVAAKIMTGSRAFDSRYQARFVREVQAVASLNHPGIVRVFDHGQVESEGGEGIRRGCPFLIMELADRGTLEDVEPDNFTDLREILLQLLDALAFAHARGVVHRDIKPGNVLLTSSPSGMRVKLSDFGIAHADDPDTEMTRSSLGEAAGTPEYMPPEQLEGRWRDFGPWTDLYALGCMVWELSTGKTPFHEGSPLQIAFGHLTDELPEFEPRMTLPDGFREWLLRLLEKKPVDRFQRAADAAFELQRLQFDTPEWDPPSGEVFVEPPSTGAGLEEESDWSEAATTVLALDVIPSFGFGSADGPAGMEEDSEPTATVVLDPSSIDWSSSDSTDESRSYPPIPRDWRRRSSDLGAEAVGLGLFGLREAPFIGREAERDLIWEALREVDATGGPRTVVLRGRSGTGKSRTVEWIAQRAEELGVATVLRAQHGLRPTAKHGLGHMLSRHFVAWRIDDFSGVIDRVRTKLEVLWRDVELPAEDFVAQEARGLASIIAPHSDGMNESNQLSADERLAAVQRVVERTADRRPVLLWIDDAQWGDEALTLADRLQREAEFPVLIVLTVQSDAEPTDGAAGLLETIGAQETVRSTELGFLPPERQRELVQRLAGLSVQTADRVVAATAGNPLFAIQLIGHWVQGGHLRPTPSGYVVNDDIDVAAHMHDLWQRRLESVTESLGGLNQQVALELASVLGDDVLEVEWRGTCIVAGVEPHDRLVDVLVDKGLAVRFESGWSFVHKLVADGVRTAARESGRWELLQRCCVEVLATIYEGDHPSVARRIASHCIEAGDHAEAIAPLAAAAELLIGTGDLREAAECVALWGEALDALSVPNRDDRRIQQLLQSALLEIRAGNAASGRQMLETVLESGGGAAVEGKTRAFRLKAELETAAGRLDAAMMNFARAEAHLGDVSLAEQAAFFEARAIAHKSLGDPQSAREDLERALDLHREAGDAVREVNVFGRLANTFLTEGHLDVAREVAEMGIELGRQLGNRGAEATCWTALGEVERATQNLEAATSCYHEAERLDELGGSRHVWIVRTNLALLRLATPEAGNAVDEFAALRETAEDVGYHWLVPTITFGMAVANAAAGDWHAASEQWRDASSRIAQSGMVERDYAWLAERMADVSEAEGDSAWATAALREAVRYWDALGDLWKSREARIRLRHVSSM